MTFSGEKLRFRITQGNWITFNLRRGGLPQSSEMFLFRYFPSYAYTRKIKLCLYLHGTRSMYTYNMLNTSIVVGFARPELKMVYVVVDEEFEKAIVGI